MSTPTSNTAPTPQTPNPPTTPAPKRTSGVSPLVIVLIFGALLGGVTYGIYVVGSSYGDKDQASSIGQVVSADGPYTRAEAYTKMFQGVFKAGSGLAASANISPEMMMGLPLGGMGSGPGADEQFEARQLSQEEIAAMNGGSAEEQLPSRDELLAKELGDNQGGTEDQLANTEEQGNNSDQPAQTNDPIQSQKFVFIGKPSLFMGDNVITELSTIQPDGSYAPDQSAWAELANQQFTQAKLTRAELTTLAAVDLDGAAIADSDAELLKKFVRLFYYGKLLNKGAALEVLLDKVHPSIKAAALLNPDLSVGNEAQPGDMQPESNTAQNNQQDYNASLQQLQQQQEAMLQGLQPQAQDPQPSGLDAASAEMEYERGRSAANSGNFVQALQIWKPLAQQGNAKAQTAIGRMYARGDGVAKDFSEALAWFKMAADAGDSKALIAIGKLYMNGDGVKRDKNTAATYFSRALAAGNQDAKPLLKEALQ